MSDNLKRYEEILEMATELMRELLKQASVKKQELQSHRIPAALAAQEREGTASIKLRIVQDELDRLSTAIGESLGLDRPARSVEIQRRLNEDARRRVSEMRGLLVAGAHELKKLSSANQALMANTMRYAGALIGAMAPGAMSSYGNDGSIVVPQVGPLLTGRV